MYRHSIQLSINHPLLERAFRIAAGDFAGNITPYVGEDGRVAPCILAGLDYDKPWTRDAALNSWYAGSMFVPGVARNTLQAVLIRDADGPRIGGEYWDAIIWVTAAWAHYLWSGDREFLTIAFTVTLNSLRYFEHRERDPVDGLFRGGACFQDGVSGYPDRFADGPTSGIADWVKAHPSSLSGHGLPMKALSTNCLYYNAYRLLPAMACALGIAVDPVWEEKAERLRAAINKRFWNPATGTYRYLVDADDPVDRQEGFGHAFALLFGIADGQQARRVIDHQHITPHGIACVWPSYERYTNEAGTSFGRHSGTIWPQVNTAWAMALVAHGRRDLAWKELELLAAKACRDNQFAEIYHPLTGEIYGGMQEWYDGGTPRLWVPCQRQTWCATGFMGMVLHVLGGVRLERESISFDPWLPEGMNAMTLQGIRYRECEINLRVERSGVPGIVVNEKNVASAFVAAGESSGSVTEILIRQ